MKTWKLVLIITDDGITSDERQGADVERYLTQEEIEDLLPTDLEAGIDYTVESCTEVEDQEPPKWIYLSFVGTGGFLGGCFVQGDMDSLAVPVWKIVGLPKEPIKEIAAFLIPPEKADEIPADHSMHNRLLSKEELKAFRPMVRGDGTPA